jgi:hypothetical protein
METKSRRQPVYAVYVKDVPTAAVPASILRTLTTAFDDVGAFVAAIQQGYWGLRMLYFYRSARIAALSLGLSVSCIGAVPASQATIAINSCETFRTWFAQQPASKIFSIGPRDSENGVHPSAFDTILTYRWNTMRPSDPAFEHMRFYTTNVGGGGCMAGYYDAPASRALVFLVYGTATDLVITRTTSIPGGLPRRSVPSGTKRGAKLGMSLAQVQKVEGPGKIYTVSGVSVLSYNQNVSDSHGGTRYGHLAFLFVSGKVEAINVGGGH